MSKKKYTYEDMIHFVEYVIGKISETVSHKMLEDFWIVSGLYLMNWEKSKDKKSITNIVGEKYKEHLENSIKNKTVKQKEELLLNELKSMSTNTGLSEEEIIKQYEYGRKWMNSMQENNKKRKKLNLKKPILRYEEPVKSVPYQKCPVCDGHGITTKSIKENGIEHFHASECHICNGKGIIPQYIIEDKHCTCNTLHSLLIPNPKPEL